MIDSTTYLTSDGLEKLRLELTELVHTKRKEIAARIQEAKELGDLSENAEYQGAREEQAFNEGRIEEIEAILRTAVIINDSSKKKELVQVGSTVTMKFHGKSQTVQIVGSNEADPMTGTISNVSPIGQALLGHRAGETVIAKTPKGDLEIQIESLS